MVNEIYQCICSSLNKITVNNLINEKTKSKTKTAECRRNYSSMMHAFMRKSQLGGGDERTLPHFFIFRSRRARYKLN